MAIQKVIQIDADTLKAQGGLENLDKIINKLNKDTTDLNATFEDVYGDLQPLTTRMGELEDRMYELALAGQKNSKEYKDLEVQVGKYKKTIQQTDLAVDAAAMTTSQKLAGAMQGVAGAFSIGQSAAALFGNESEELEKTMVKLQSAMALSQGIAGLKESANVFNAIGVSAKNALSGIRTGLLATGLGAFVVVLGTVVAYWDDIKEAVNGANKEQEIYNSLQSEAIKNASKEVSQLDTLYKTTQNHTLSLQQRKLAVDKLQEQYPYYFKNISDEAILNGRATDSYQKLRQAIIDVAMAKAAQQKIEEISAKYLEKEIELNKNRADSVNEYKTAQDEVRTYVGQGGGGVYTISAEEKRAGAKAKYNRALKEQAENQRLLNAELRPYLDIVQKTIGLEETLSNKSISPSTNNQVKAKLSGTKADKPISNEKLVGLEDTTKVLSEKDIQFNAFEQKTLNAIDLEKTFTNVMAEEAERQKAIEQAKYEHKMMMLDATSALLMKGAQAIGEQTAVGKGLAVAAATIDTYTAANKALKADYGIFGPAAQIARFASVAATIGLGIKNVKSIISTKVPSVGGSGSSTSPSSASISAPNFNIVGNTGVNQIAQTIAGQQPVKAYVVAKEVTTQQELDRNKITATRI